MGGRDDWALPCPLPCPCTAALLLPLFALLSSEEAPLPFAITFDTLLVVLALLLLLAVEVVFDEEEARKTVRYGAKGDATSDKILYPSCATVSGAACTPGCNAAYQSHKQSFSQGCNIISNESPYLKHVLHKGRVNTMREGILVQNDTDGVLVDVVCGQCGLSSCHQRLRNKQWNVGEAYYG